MLNIQVLFAVFICNTRQHTVYVCTYLCTYVCTYAHVMWSCTHVYVHHTGPQLMHCLMKPISVKTCLYRTCQDSHTRLYIRTYVGQSHALEVSSSGNHWQSTQPLGQCFLSYQRGCPLLRSTYLQNATLCVDVGYPKHYDRSP